MALTVGELQVLIEAETGPLKRDLKQVRREFDGFARRGQASARKFGAGIGKITALVGGLVAVLGTLAATRAFVGLAKSAVTVASEFESFEVRLKGLLGSQTEANNAFETFIDLSAKTPFAVKQIVGGAATLAAVALGNRESLEELTGVAANLAAVTGLGFQEAASNLQRALSAGIAAADLFRDRGVKRVIESVRGIPDLLALPLEEQRKAFVDTFGNFGEFGTAAEDLSFTLGGALSNITDASTNFKAALGDALSSAIIDNARRVFIPFFKTLQKLVEDNDGAIETFARGAIGFLINSLAIAGKAIIFTIRTFVQFRQGIREVAFGIERLKSALGLDNDLALFRAEIIEERKELAKLENQLTSFENALKNLQRTAADVASKPAGLGTGAPVRPDREFDTGATEDAKTRTKRLAAEKKAEREELARTKRLFALRSRLRGEALEQEVDENARLLFEIDRQIEEVARQLGQARSTASQQAGLDVIELLQAQRQEIADQIANPISEGTKEGLTAAFSAFAEGDFAGFGDALFDMFNQQTETALTTAFGSAVDEFGKLFNSAIVSAGKALPSLFGEGGFLSGLGGRGGEIASGLLGIGAGLFRGLSEDADVTNTSRSVKSAVTSTQAVRGVVAGPTQIAVAQVGNDIRDAFLESERLLELIARATRETADNTSGAGGGGGGGAALADTAASLT